MIFDINTYIGHFPFRQIHHNSLPQLRAYLAKAGIDKSVVTNLNAVFYRNVQDGNRELLALLRENPDIAGYFVPACVINPRYPRWDSDLRENVEKNGFKMVVLFPSYHDYRLDSPDGIAALKACAELGVPVHLPCSLENIRQRHHMDVDRNPEPEEVYKALLAVPEVDIAITAGDTVAFAARLCPLREKRSGRVYYDFSKLDPIVGTMGALLREAGADRILFGSIAPLQYPHCQTYKLQAAEYPEDVKRKIACENLQALLGM